MSWKRRVAFFAALGALLAITWYNASWQSAALVCAFFVIVFVFDSIFGKGKSESFGAAILLLGIALWLLNSVFGDMVAAIKISAGFFLLKGSLDLFVEAFEKPLRAWLGFRREKKTAGAHDSSGNEIVEPQISKADNCDGNDK